MSEEISKPLNILLVDDDEMNNYIHTHLIKKYLVGRNVEIVSCINGAIALEHLLNLRKRGDAIPDYIFLDISMPVMDGWGFLDEYGKHNLDPMGRCKIYIISSTVFNQDFVKARTYHAVNDMLSKPLTVEKIKQLIEIE